MNTAEYAQARPEIRYRPDIDGLRAVAVLLVLADHLHTRFGGGFVGVDVFFVISGYLISSLLLREMDQGRFSIAHFYERRVRRIFPALLAMLLVTTLLVYRYFVPAEVEAYGRSLLAALFSVSNFLFWHQAGYFDAPSALKPLLHTWSLAVEEQFYLLFPPFLLLLRRFFPRRLKAAIIGVALLSFGCAVWVLPRDPVAAFFFAPLRAWELLLGTVVSQHYLPRLRRTWTRNAASLVGLVLIVVPALRYQFDTPFPGLTALPPCAGAALIIAAGETGSSLVGRLLSWRPVVFVGLISYSLYLWHWPIIVFQNTSSMLFQGPAISSRSKALLAIVSIAVATLSWALVERPFRTGRFRPSGRGVFAISGAATTAMALLAILLVTRHGLPQRFPPDARAVAAFTDYDEQRLYREGTCFLGPDQGFAVFRKDTCLAFRPGAPSVLLLGDSHAAQLWPGLAAVFPNLALLQANASACPPFPNQPAAQRPACRELSGYLFREFLLQHHPDTLLLAARWAPYELGDLAAAIEWAHAHGFHVVVVGPGVEYDSPMPRVIATALRDGDPERIEAARSQGPQQLDRQMRELARTVWHVPYISIYADLCTPTCPLYAAPRVPLLFDTDHFTEQGSVLLARAMRARHQLPGEDPSNTPF